MNNQHRRFCATLVAFASIIAMASLPNKAVGQGVINISSYMGLGPVTPTQGFVSDVSYALLYGLPSYGSWQPIANGSAVNVTNIFRTGSIGKKMYCALAVTSSVPFTLAGVYSTQDTPFFSFAGTLGDDGATYNLFGIGISSNGTTYTSGNANTPVNALYIIGYGYSINITGSTFLQASNDWADIPPFNYTVSYTVNGQTTSSSIQFVPPATPVPEPTSMTIIAMGACVLLRTRMRSRMNCKQ